MHQEKTRPTYTENILSIKNINKSFIDGNKRNFILENINFDLKRGEFVSIVAPNGAGKTTLLRIIASRILPDSGMVNFNGDPREDISYIQQNYVSSLMKFYKADRNISFPLEKNNYTKEQRKEKVAELVRKCGITLPLESYPYQCSGGQRQLIGIMRGLITSPKLLLMDEPFSALDYYTRISMAETLMEIWDKIRTATIFVTHEPDEAILLSERVIVLSKKPAKIVEEIHVDLPRPRTHEITKAEAFDSYRHKVLDALSRGMKQ